MDVRMLGAGRPFVLELQNPRRVAWDPALVAAVEAAVAAGSNSEVLVRRVAPCDKGAMAALQRDAEAHTKTYVCLCWSERALASGDMAKLTTSVAFEVAQKTPLRVMHRRGGLVRPRTVHWTEATLLNAHYFTLRLHTQAGMYIKEFVHGDLGRTQPSVRGMLSSNVEILQLDVEGVERECDPQG